MSRLTLALDAMGGDIGPRITMPASIKALENDPMLSLLLFGDSEQINPFLNNLSTDLLSRIQVRHCSSVIDGNQSFKQALRYSKGTSMRAALEAVQNGEADGCVSGGNTGALMGLATLIIKPLEGIQRPALISLLPTIDGENTVMLDLGANIDCSAENLYQFAVMGAIFAENRLDLVYPRIALLNIGIEEIKGYKSIRDASKMLKKHTALNYIGFIESNLLLNGQTDVIVADGFAGNIALKTLEGAAKNLITLIKGNSSSKRPVWCKKALGIIVKWLMRKRLQKLKNINPDQYNGASLIGLNSVIVKSHGGANEQAFYHAICDATLQVRQQIPQKILLGLERY